MQFDELILQDSGQELQVRFHPHLTMLAGLGPAERQELTKGLLAALAGGDQPSELRYLDGTGQAVTLTGADGRVRAEHADGTRAAEPIGTLAPDAKALRRLVVIRAEDLGGEVTRSREDEPPELREARDMLEELAAELQTALGREQAVAELQAMLDAVDEELRIARDGVARRAYAEVLAQLERVRAEAAALQSGTAGIEADRHLLANVDSARRLAERWTEASARTAALRADQTGGEHLDPADLPRLAGVPEVPPAGLEEGVSALTASVAERDALDHRLQDLAVAQLPAPSHPLVAELGLLDQLVLWQVADRVERASEAVQRVQVALGGLELDDMGPAPTLIADIEAAHSELEAADRAVASARVPGMAGAGVGVTAGVLGLAAAPVLLPLGLMGAAVAAGAGIVRPLARRSRAQRAERAALGRAEATSYLGFHIRRVEASIDPTLREAVETASTEHRGAMAAWAELVGPAAVVADVRALADEIRAYHDAVQNLGDTADEIEQLRAELGGRAEPAVAAARSAVLELCRPYLLEPEHLDEPAGIVAFVESQCDRGRQARAALQMQYAFDDEQKAAAQLDDLLLSLGFDAGELDARVGALEWAVTRADEREQARLRARPRTEIDAELAELTEAAARLRQPEWATVTAADASTPDIPELECRRNELLSQLAEARAEVDLERLADRHAAVERRVAALEARLSGSERGTDPGVVADIQNRLLARLTVAAQAAPHGDPVPVVLDEAFQRVPADRTFDLLDMVLRVAEHQQIIYLTDDGFVAAWARQRALDGAITLLEPAPEHETV